MIYPKYLVYITKLEVYPNQFGYTYLQCATTKRKEMTPDEYVLSLVSNYSVSTGSGSAAFQAAQKLYPTIKGWAGKYLLSATFSGSYAKSTTIKGGTDVDIFISLDSQTPGTLKEIYENLYSYLDDKHLSPRRQNVSIGLSYSGVSIDLVPGRKQAGNTSDHSLYRNKANTWTQTNVGKHIELISESGRLVEIKALKIWRKVHYLDFPSFYLELTILDALYNKKKNQPASNVWTVIEYLRDSFSKARVVDPANSNNIISDDLTSAEKGSIVSVAKNSVAQANWGSIIW